MQSTNGKATPDKYIFNIEQIKELLPHRYPFLLVDRVIELDPGKRCVGLKAVSANEQFFEGHFPGKAIMPGVLVIEAMAQVGGIMMLAVENNKGMLAYLAAVDNAKFRQPVVPGDVLITECNLLRVRGNMGKVHAIGRVDGQIVVEADVMFALVAR
ncbi:MAG TPA: 3-hydroxyacyl-ACP dehydratase FabZ [Capsulimonadaceae bacterium]|jgi:3-hydroxyacyl-[acyl-carrier-protein] dehydratase